MKKSLFAITLLAGMFLLADPFLPETQNHIFNTAHADNFTVNLGPPYDNTDAQKFLAGILGYFQSIAGYIAVLFIVLGGVLYMLAATGAGNEDMMRKAKTCWTAALIGLVVVGAAPTFLHQIVAITGMPSDTSEARSLKQIVMQALAFLLSIAGSLAIIGLVVSGILYTTAAGQKGQIDSAKRAMTYSIIGIIVAGSALILVQQITNLIT